MDDEIDRFSDLGTLSVDLPAWQESLQSLFAEAERTLGADSGGVSDPP